MQVICLYRPSSPSPQHGRARSREEGLRGRDGAWLLRMGKSLGAGPRRDPSRVPARAEAATPARGPGVPHRARPPAPPTDGVTPFVASHPSPFMRTSHGRRSKAPRRWDSQRGPGKSGGTGVAVMEESCPPSPWAGGQALREELCLLLPHLRRPCRHSCTENYYIFPCKFATSAYLM